MFKKRIFIAIGILLAIIAVTVFFAIQQSKKLHRDPLVLMNKYYQFKKSNPTVAKKSLLIILNQDANYLPALKEYTQWMLADNNPDQAIVLLRRLHENVPENATYAFQLGYLYYLNGEWERSSALFVHMLKHVTGAMQVQVIEALKAMGSYLPYYQYHAASELLTVASMMGSESTTHVPVMRRKMGNTVNDAKPQSNYVKSMFDNYYTLKVSDQQSAQRLIKMVVIKEPNNVQALKEAGFLAMAEGHKIDAVAYFTRAYDLTYQPGIAMQLGYLYEQLNDKPMAYQYFRAATHGNDKKIALCAENQLTSLVGQQIKVLPAPYFAEMYFNPFSQTYFGLTVLPFIGRVGIEQDNRFRTKEYVFLRRTQDNRSNTLGEISQIYEDDVQITGVGLQVTPFKRLPLVAFFEVGESYDLVYRNRNRWRGDVRSGLMYYQDFGTRPAYFDNLKISHDYYSDWYADVTYFSRYDNNVIGLVRTHQGIRLLQYQSSMLNLYVTGRVIADTRREFYNNIAEIGPGVSFVPSNRFNVQLRYERVNGVYLPAGASVNPYNKYYINQIVQLLFYIKL